MSRAAWQILVAVSINSLCELLFIYLSYHIFPLCQEGYCSLAAAVRRFLYLKPSQKAFPSLQIRLISVICIKEEFSFERKKEPDNVICASSRPYGVFASGRFQQNKRI